MSNTENSRKRSAGNQKPWKDLGGTPDGVSKKDMGNKRSDSIDTQDAGNTHRDKSTNGGRQWKSKGGAPSDIKKVDPRSKRKDKDYKNNA